MAVFRVEKNHNYTVMSNYHLRDKNLSLKASGLLSKMLSLTEEWNYTTRGLAAICKEGVDAIGSTLRELEANGYLIRTQLRDAKGRISDTEYVIYEQPHTPLPCTTPPDTEKPDMDTPETEPPYPKKPAQLNIDIRTPERSKTDLFTTDISNPYPSNPPTPYGTPFAATGWDEIGYEETRETVRENLEYDILQERYSKERLDEIVDLLTETICSRKQTTVIAGDEYPTALVRDKLLKITPSHIEYVFDCLDRNTTYVRNIKKYILAALFNAPSTIDSYYSALVNHDLHGGSR